jgi:hypothetical protein
MIEAALATIAGFRISRGCTIEELREPTEMRSTDRTTFFVLTQMTKKTTYRPMPRRWP